MTDYFTAEQVYQSLKEENAALQKVYHEQQAELETLRAKLKVYEDLGGAADDVQLLRMGYAAARLEIESLRAALATPQPAPAAQGDALDAARYRWLAASCRSTSEHWGGRWSIIIDGPAPKSHDSEDDFDAAIDAARARLEGKP